MNTSFDQRLTTLEARLDRLIATSKTKVRTEVVYDTLDFAGYEQAVAITGGSLIFHSGITPWDHQHTLPQPTGDLLEQTRAAFKNLKLLLNAQGLNYGNLVSLRVYIAKPNYYGEMDSFIELLSELFGGPLGCTITVIGVTGLAEPEQLVEVEAVATADA